MSLQQVTRSEPEPSDNDFVARSARGTPYTVATIAVVGLAVGLRIVDLDKGLRLDEHSSLTVTAGADWLGRLREYDHPPLYFLLLRAARSLSERVEWLRSISILAAAGMVVVAMTWLRRQGQVVGVLAGLLLAAHPELVHYGQEIRHYSLLCLLTILATAGADRVLVGRPRALAALGFVWVALVSAHAVGALVVLSTVAYLAAAASPGRRSDVLRGAVAAAVPALVLVGWQAIAGAQQIRGRQDAGWMDPPDAAALAGLFERALGSRGWVWFRESFGLAAPTAELAPWAVPCGVCLLVGAVVVAAPIDRRRWAIGIAALAFLLQIVAVSRCVVAVLNARTFLPGLTLLLLFGAAQVGSARPRMIRMFGIGAVLIACTVWSVWWLRVEGKRPFGPWAAISADLTSRRAASDPVLVCPPYLEQALLHELPQLRRGLLIPVRAFERPEELAALVDVAIRRFAAAETIWFVSRYVPNRRWASDPCGALRRSLPLTPDASAEYPGGVTVTPFRLQGRRQGVAGE